MISKSWAPIAGPLRPERNSMRTTVKSRPVNPNEDTPKPFVPAMHGVSCDPLGPEPRQARSTIARLPSGKHRKRFTERAIPGVVPVPRAKKIGSTAVWRAS
jgi:hypothetical protein